MRTTSAPWWCWVLLSLTAVSTPARRRTWLGRCPARRSWWYGQVRLASPHPGGTKPGCLACPPPAPFLPAAQPAADATMEEEALHKARRLTDYYDVHEEIGRYRAAGTVGMGHCRDRGAGAKLALGSELHGTSNPAILGLLSMSMGALVPAAGEKSVQLEQNQAWIVLESCWSCRQLPAEQAPAQRERGVFCLSALAPTTAF